MLTGLYVSKDTFFHRLDPRAKLLWTFLVLVASMATQFNGIKGTPVFISAVVALALSGIGAGFAALLIFNMLAFLIAVTLVWAGMYSSHGKVIFEVGILQLTDIGVSVAIGKFFLIICPVLAFAVFFTSTKPYHVMWVLDKLRLPHKLSLAFTISLSMLPSIVKSTREVIEVQKTRGLALDRGGPLERLRKHVPVIVPLIARLLSDIWDLGMVLASRYAGYGKRTYVFEPKWTKRDSIFLIFSILFYGGVALWGIFPYT
ncbi:MAG: energy-coupling factor transporter transmembrane component T [Thermofilaceae archaeon]